jgi:hypothetical protein
MTEKEINTTIMEITGWRRWQFGDPWIIGLKLADNQFNGYIRRVVQDAPADSHVIKLDVDEVWTYQTKHVIENFTPMSHWVKGSNIVARPIQYCKDLNEINKVCLEHLTPEEKRRVGNLLFHYGLKQRWTLNNSDYWTAAIYAPADERARAFLRVINYREEYTDKKWNYIL